MKKLLLLPLILALLFGGVASADTMVDRNCPEYVESGEWFEVSVTFICPEDETNAIGIADNLEGVVDAQGDIEWCEPTAFAVRVLGSAEDASMIEYVWADTYDAGTEITAVYKVLIEGEPMEEFSFDGFVAYYVGGDYRGEGCLCIDLPIGTVKIKPDQSYTLAVINEWLYGEITMSEALSVINAWVS